MPALVPHLRPAGSSPQFLVMFGAGLGSPSPVMKLPTPAALPPCAADDVFAATPMVHAASRSAAQAPNAGIRIRGFDMTPPRKSIRGHIVIGMRPDIKPRLAGRATCTISGMRGPQHERLGLFVGRWHTQGKT